MPTAVKTGVYIGIGSIAWIRFCHPAQQSELLKYNGQYLYFRQPHFDSVSSNERITDRLP